MGGHGGKGTRRRVMSKHQRGNVKADANCTAVKRVVRSKVRLVLPRRESWRLCYDRVEMVGPVLREELREKMRTEMLMSYFRGTRGCGDGHYRNRYLILKKTRHFRIMVNRVTVKLIIKYCPIKNRYRFIKLSFVSGIFLLGFPQ